MYMNLYMKLYINCLIILLAIVIIYFIYHNCFTNAVHVPKDLLYSILDEGTYHGIGQYNPTNLHPYGIKSKLKLNIMRTHNGIKYINHIDLYDAKTNELIDRGVREAHLNYKPNHKENVFQNSKSFIGENLVSSSHGKVINHTNNSLVLDSVGSWHISDHDFKHIKQTISKEGDKLVFEFKNYKSIISPLHKLYMKEEYVKLR